MFGGRINSHKRVSAARLKNLLLTHGLWQQGGTGRSSLEETSLVAPSLNASLCIYKEVQIEDILETSS